MRHLSIDILRMCAIFLMVFIHFTENLSGYSAASWMPTGFAAPIFTFLVGMSYKIWLNVQESQGVSDVDISKKTLRRSLFLFGLGFAFNIFVWLPEDTFNWDILTLIATAFFVLNFCRKVDPSLSIVVCLLVFAASPSLRVIADYPEFWTNGYFEGDTTLSEILLGFLVTGFFPLFPWILYPITGFLVASSVFPNAHSTNNKRKFPRATGLLGVVFLVLAGLVLFTRSQFPDLANNAVGNQFLEGWTMFPPSMAYVLGTLGLTLVAFAQCHYWIDQNPRFAQKTTNGTTGTLSERGRPLGTIARTFSRHSLSIYLLHHVVHLWPLWIYGSIYGDDPTQFWQNALPAYASISLSVLFLILCYFLFRWMDRTGKSAAEGLMRWVCD